MKTLALVGLLAGTAFGQGRNASPAHGCSEPELEVLSGRGTGGPPSSQCLGFPTQTDAALARNLVASPGSAVLHNVGLYLGAGFVF